MIITPPKIRDFVTLLILNILFWMICWFCFGVQPHDLTILQILLIAVQIGILSSLINIGIDYLKKT